MAELEIRPPREAELAALAELLVTQLREHHNQLPVDILASAASGLQRRPQRGQFLIALEGGALIGFAALSFLWTLERGGRAAWLDELYVLPEGRGRGIGTALLTAAMDAARACGALAIELEVDADHARAASLYRRAGFETLPRTRWALAVDPVRPAARSLPPTLDGGCFCGRVRYRITAPPLGVAHCHCSICRRATGAPFVTWATVARTAFGFSSGAPAELQATSTARRTFCADCGTALTFASTVRSDLLDVTLGSLDVPNALEPGEHIWTSSQLSWLHLDDDLPRHPEHSPEWA